MIGLYLLIRCRIHLSKKKQTKLIFKSQPQLKKKPLEQRFFYQEYKETATYICIQQEGNIKFQEGNLKFQEGNKKFQEGNDM